MGHPSWPSAARKKHTLTPALLSAQLKFQRTLLRDRTEKKALETQRLETLKLAQTTENQRIQRAYLAGNSQCSADTFYTLSIPSGPSGLSRIIEVHEQRLANYRKHLEEVIKEAIKYSDAAEAHPDKYNSSSVYLNESQRRLGDMRSHICSEYYCDTLKAYQKEAASGSELQQVLVIQRSNTNQMQLAATPENRIVRAVLVTPDRVQTIAIEGEGRQQS